jgi:hypothetical protein
MSKLIITILFILIIISGCSSNCITGEDRAINVSLGENREISTNLGATYHHNVTVNIANNANSDAKSVKIETYYCNDNKFLHLCENESFNVDNIPPNSVIKRYFEYDRLIGQNQGDGKYQLLYKAESCLPVTTVDNKVFVSQR